MMARGYMHKYNKTSADLAELAVALRYNAVPRRDAYMFNRPITVDDHQNSPFIVRPLHLLDYCLVTDGAIAFIVSTAERARDLKTKPVDLLGFGTCHEVGQGYTRGSNTILGLADLDVEPARTHAEGPATRWLDIKIRRSENSIG